jgi:hypothetical protein
LHLKLAKVARPIRRSENENNKKYHPTGITVIIQCETPQKRQYLLIFGTSYYPTGTRTQKLTEMAVKPADSISSAGCRWARCSKS